VHNIAAFYTSDCATAVLDEALCVLLRSPTFSEPLFTFIISHLMHSRLLFPVISLELGAFSESMHLPRHV
jgi:hypothetical protein